MQRKAKHAVGCQLPISSFLFLYYCILRRDDAVEIFHGEGERTHEVLFSVCGTWRRAINPSCLIPETTELFWERSEYRIWLCTSFSNWALKKKSRRKQQKDVSAFHLDIIRSFHSLLGSHLQYKTRRFWDTTFCVFLHICSSILASHCMRMDRT